MTTGPYWDAYNATRDAIVEGPDRAFSLESIASLEDWATLIARGAGYIVTAGTLSGALDALRTRGATPADILSWPLDTEDEMRTAASWLSTGLLYAQDLEDEQETVTQTLIDNDWLTDPARVTSLILAIVVVAGHAIEHHRR